MEVWLKHVIRGVLDSHFALCNVTKSPPLPSPNLPCATELTQSPDQGLGHRANT